MDDDKKKVSASSMVFRIILSAVFLLTAVGASHGVRYALLGILLCITVGERLYSRSRRHI
jgi:hypothetical protein